MRRSIAKLQRKTVVLHTIDGQSLRGVLLHWYRDCAVLDEAEHLDGDQRVKLAGHAIVPRSNVAWLQDVTG